MTCQLTEDRRLFVGTDVMVRLVKQRPKLLRHQEDKVLPVIVVNQTIREDTETLVNPQPSHGVSGVMEIFVSSQETLEYLIRKTSIEVGLKLIWNVYHIWHIPGFPVFFTAKFQAFSRTFPGYTRDFKGLLNVKFQDFSSLNWIFLWYQS